MLDRLANNDSFVEFEAAKVPVPDIRLHRSVPHDEGPYWLATDDLQECGVPALVRFQIDPAEGDGPVDFVIMDSQVRETLVTSANDQTVDEHRVQSAVAEFSWNVVDALAGRVHFTNMRYQSPVWTRDASKQDNTVLCPVAGK